MFHLRVSRWALFWYCSSTILSQPILVQHNSTNSHTILIQYNDNNSHTHTITAIFIHFLIQYNNSNSHAIQPTVIPIFNQILKVSPNLQGCLTTWWCCKLTKFVQIFFFGGSLDAKLVLKSRLRCEKRKGINSLRIQGCVQFYFRGLTRRPPLENFEKELSTHICQGLEQLVHMLHPHKLNSNWVIDNKRWTKFRVQFTSKLK